SFPAAQGVAHRSHAREAARQRCQLAAGDRSGRTARAGTAVGQLPGRGSGGLHPGRRGGAAGAAPRVRRRPRAPLRTGHRGRLAARGHPGRRARAVLGLARRGGNFGVVTGMEIELVPVTGLYGGSLFFDVAEVPHVLEAWREWTSTAPEEMTSAVAVLPYPDVEGVPAPLRGRYVAQIQLAHLGSAAEGERVLQPLRELGPHLQDTLRELPYAESGSVFAEPDQPHAYRSDHWLLADLDPRSEEHTSELQSREKLVCRLLLEKK